jgi:hypothetical protein
MTWLVRDLIPANTFVIPIEDDKQIFAVGQARDRTPGADVDDHRVRAPWFVTKAEPSTADMAANFASLPDLGHLGPASQPPEEINVIRLAWEDLAA